MNLSEMVLAVQRVLKDATILRTEIVAELNRQQMLATSRVLIPSMTTSGKITLPAGVIAGVMPVNFQQDLLSAYSETYDRWLTVRTNLKALYDGYTLGNMHAAGFPMTTPFTLQDASESSVGPIQEVAVDGSSVDDGERVGVLWVRPATLEEEIVQIRYYRKPIAMAENTDTPEIDEEWHRGLLVSGTLIEKLPESEIPPEVIGQLLPLHTARYASALAELKARYPYTAKKTPKPRRTVKEF